MVVFTCPYLWSTRGQKWFMAPQGTVRWVSNVTRANWAMDRNLRVLVMRAGNICVHFYAVLIVVCLVFICARSLMWFDCPSLLPDGSQRSRGAVRLLSFSLPVWRRRRVEFSHKRTEVSWLALLPVSLSLWWIYPRIRPVEKITVGPTFNYAPSSVIDIDAEKSEEEWLAMGKSAGESRLWNPDPLRTPMMGQE